MTGSAPLDLAPAADAPRDSGVAGAASPPLPGAFRGAIAAIWLRELRGRMRGKRAFIFITVYLTLLVGLLWLGLRSAMAFPSMGALDQVNVGRGIFSAVILVETLVVVALAPAYTAGAISQERERRTFDLLAVTPVSSLAIVAGKLLSGLSYLALIVAASIPVASLAFLFGGLAPQTVALAYLLLAVVGIGVGAVGIACSALLRRTQPATVAAYLVVATLVVGATFAWGILSQQARFEGRQAPPEALIWLNPFFAQADVVCAGTSALCIPGITMPEIHPFDPPPADSGGDGAVHAETAVLGPGALWPKSAASWALVAVVMLGLASQVLAPSRRWRAVPRRPLSGEPAP